MLVCQRDARTYSVVVLVLDVPQPAVVLVSERDAGTYHPRNVMLVSYRGAGTMPWYLYHNAMLV